MGATSTSPAPPAPARGFRSPSRRPRASVALGVFVAALCVFLPWIGAQEIWSKDEARTALVVKEMLATGDWSLPRVPGGDHSRKPPLYHWLTALGARRGLDETTLRLTAAMAAAGTAALTYLIGTSLATRAVGLMAASVLIASPTFFGWARICRMDTLLAFCITLSLWGFARWLVLGGRVNGLLFGIGIGLGVLTKGPAGLLPLAIAAFALMACRVQYRRLREFAPGLVLAAVVPLAWLIPASVAAPDFTRYARGVVPTLAGELAREASSSLNVAVGLVAGFLPWTLLLPGCVVVLVRRRPMSSPLVVVSLGWLLVILMVFGIVVPSRSVHFLPAYPALALLVAWGWHRAEGGQRRWRMV